MKITVFHIVFLAFLTLLSAPAFSQGPAPEEDISAFDSTEVLTLLDEAIRLDEPDSIETVLERALRISESIRFDRGTEGAFLALSRHYRNTGSVSSELRVRLKRQQYYKKNELPKEMTQGLIEIADLYFSSGIFGKAEDAYRHADTLAVVYAPDQRYRLARQLARSSLQLGWTSKAKVQLEAFLSMAEKKGKWEDQLWVHQQLGKIAHRNQRYATEVKHALAARKLAQAHGDRNERIVALNNLGYAYKYNSQIDSAMACFKQVLDVLPENDPEGLRASMEANLGILQFSNGDSREALRSLTDAAADYGKLGREDMQATTLDYLALVFNRRKDYFNALQSNERAIAKAKSAGAAEVEASAYRTRSVIYQDLYEFEDALKYYKMHLNLRDSLSSQARDKKQGILLQEATLERLEKELDMLYAKEELQEKENERQKLENEALAKKAALLQTEKQLTEADLRYTQSQVKLRQADAMRALNSLKLLEEKRKTEIQQSEIALLNQENSIKELEIEKQRMSAAEKEQKVVLLQKDKKLQDLELAQRTSRIRNLVYLLLGMAFLVMLVLLALFAVRRKNRIIAQERTKSDNLLLNILPLQVANELKTSGSSTPRHYDEVTVVFTDFSGFTMISEKLSPQELVHTLDKIFQEFDRITEQMGLTRIKTIGDAYMAACGLPDKDNLHAEKSVRAALMMRDYISRFNNLLAPGEPHWNIRIGLHSGPVVAGVVGKKKFAYDIWGDTVNTASRMESSGAVGKVNVSGATFELVKDKFAHEFRGKVHAKNKGDIEMYFLENGRG